MRDLSSTERTWDRWVLLDGKKKISTLMRFKMEISSGLRFLSALFRL